MPGTTATTKQRYHAITRVRSGPRMGPKEKETPKGRASQSRSNHSRRGRLDHQPGFGESRIESGTCNIQSLKRQTSLSRSNKDS